MEIIEIVHEENAKSDLRKEELMLKYFPIDDFIKEAKEKFLNDEFYKVPYLWDLVTNHKSYKVALGVSFEIHAVTKKIESLVNDLAYFQLEKIKNNYINFSIYTIEEAKRIFPLSSNISVGTYVKHPKNSSLITPLKDYYSNLAEEKNDELVILFGKMGAKELIIETIDNYNMENATTAKANLNKVKANIKVEVEFETEKFYRIKVTYVGNKVEIDENLLRKSLWFSDDSKINSIFQARRFEQNALVSYDYLSKLSGSYGLEIDFMAKYHKIGVGLKNDYEKNTKIEKKYSIIFGK